MRRFMKSAFAIFAILCFFASATFAAPKDELDALCKDMKKVNNGKMNVEVTGKFLDDTFNIITNLDFESRPSALVRGETEVTVYKKGDMNNPKKTAYEFYAEDEGKQYTYYYTEKGKNEWIKDSVSTDDKKTEKDAVDTALSKIGADKIGDLTETVAYDDKYMSMVGRGDKVGYKVTFDVRKFVELMSEVALEKATKEEAQNIKVIQSVAKDLPPVNYTVIGDTKKREIVALDMPLTDFLRGANTAIAGNNNVDAMLKVVAVMALSKAELRVKAEGTDYNKVKVTKLADNIKKNAKQAEKKTDKK